MNLLMNCCDGIHPFDRFEVERLWSPPQLRCLIVGENPGSYDSPYFYERPRSYENDPVKVRRGLLQNLFKQKLLPSATLKGFQEAGFLFDHAIRCPLSQKVIAKERVAAMKYASIRVQNPTHLLTALTQAPIVWVMGHLASNAVANLTAEFPKEQRRISSPPFPGEVGPKSRFFVSSYLTRWNEKDWPEIFVAFAQFFFNRKVVDSLP